MKSGLVGGMIIGTFVGMMISPGLNKKTKRKIRRTDRMLINMAGHVYNTILKNKLALSK